MALDIKQEAAMQERIEREFVRLVLEEAKRKRLKKIQVARVAFPDAAQPGRKLHACSVRSKLGKPQTLKLREAHMLAVAVGASLQALYLLASERVRLRDLEAGNGESDAR